MQRYVDLREGTKVSGKDRPTVSCFKSKGQSMWDLCCTKWHSDWFFSEHLDLA